MISRKDEIRKFLVQEIGRHPRDIARFASETFKISRQAIHRHLDQLIAEDVIAARGNTRSREYYLKAMQSKNLELELLPSLQEDKIWRESVRPLLDGVPSNVIHICQYGFTEMLNNAIDHSEGKTVSIDIHHTAAEIHMGIKDDGVGIFNKIKRELNLEDERYALLELVKGKLTTDPAHHTGEGIFFTSRMFDHFSILSGRLFFAHLPQSGDWQLEDEDESQEGTYVVMDIDPNSRHTLQEVFDRYASGEAEYGFTRTHVPVALARYGDENLISRSQAKRLLAHFDRFKEILLDFNGINLIGQAFADEIFRVFQRQNPEVNLKWINANEEVEKMIKRAQRRAD